MEFGVSVVLTVAVVLLSYLLYQFIILQRWAARLSVIDKLPGESKHWLLGTVAKVGGYRLFT
jgi:hypothetical protein